MLGLEVNLPLRVVQDLQVSTCVEKGGPWENAQAVAGESFRSSKPVHTRRAFDCSCMCLRKMED